MEGDNVKCWQIQVSNSKTPSFFLSIAQDDELVTQLLEYGQALSAACDDATIDGPETRSRLEEIFSLIA